MGGVAQLVEHSTTTPEVRVRIPLRLKNFPMPLRGSIARLYAFGDPVDESNVEPVFAQLCHYKLTSYFKYLLVLNMRAQHTNS